MCNNFFLTFTKILKLFYFDMILIKFLRFLLGCLYTANKNVNQPFTRDWLNYVKNKQCKHVVKQAVLPCKHPRKINVKISDLIYNQSQCMTFAKSIIMFVSSIISANNSNKLQRYYFIVISFNISANIKNIFHNFFFHHPKKSK